MYSETGKRKEKRKELSELNRRGYLYVSGNNTDEKVPEFGLKWETVTRKIKFAVDAGRRSSLVRNLGLSGRLILKCSLKKWGLEYVK